MLINRRDYQYKELSYTVRCAERDDAQALSDLRL